MRSGILIFGGTGVFGSRLALGLVRDGVSGITIVSRSDERAAAAARELGCAHLAMDRDSSDVADRISALSPFAVVDAAGPFQAYGDDPYRLARAAIASGAHYLDLSDDAAFTAGISTLDAEARAAGVAVLSGVSSVPAISAAAVRALSAGLVRIDLIDSVIVPGNRAPRGASVVRAILSQIGLPLPNGEVAWTKAERITLSDTHGHRISRWVSPIGAPDLRLFASEFGAREVRFRAGLELPVMHFGLLALARAVRRGWMRSALPLAPILTRLARIFEPFGSDVGGMKVRVVGRSSRGDFEERAWTLIAAAGDGPHVPAIPARALLARWLSKPPRTGARPALHDLTLEQIEGAASERSLRFHRATAPWRPLFEDILGDAFAELPAEIQELHTVVWRRHWAGTAEVVRGKGPLARAAAWMMRFPPTMKGIPVRVVMTRSDGTEVWERHFGSHAFRSVLRPGRKGAGLLFERFGPLTFAIRLTVRNDALTYPVTKGWCLGIPIPRVLLPISDTKESVDDDGRAAFDVALSHPLTGLIVRYRGWLRPDVQPISGESPDVFS